MDETTGTHQGGCLCGALRYETTGKPLWVAYCHCHSCRRSTGAPVTTFVGYNKTSFRYTTGKPEGYNSSPGITRSFCTRCGTPCPGRFEARPGDWGARRQPVRLRDFDPTSATNPRPRR